MKQRLGGRPRGWLAYALATYVMVSVAAAVTAGVASGIGWRPLVDGFVVSSVFLGTVMAVAGWPIAHRRPDNPIGWLLLGAGAAYATSAAGYAVLAATADPLTDNPWAHILATVTNLAWVPALTLLVPLSLLMFPDGHLLSSRWRAAVGLALVATVLFEAMAILGPETLTGQLGVRGYPLQAAPDAAWVPVLGASLVVAGFALTLVSLVLRYRRGEDSTRRQVLWLLLAALIIVVVGLVDPLVGENWVAIYSLAAVPLAVMVALIRHQLLDIRLVVSRSVMYLLLTAVLIVAYGGLVTLLDAPVRREADAWPALAVTLLIAIAFNPVRAWLQTRVDRLFYGARGDPVRAIEAVGDQLVEGEEAGLVGAVEALRSVLRLPWASVDVDGRVVAETGIPGAAEHRLPLRQGAVTVGVLRVGLRSGEATLSQADRRVIALVAVPLSVALRATMLAEDLSRAREQVVLAREEERRRLRRDLHDGLGPRLAGIGLKAHAAQQSVGTDPTRTELLLGELQRDTSEAVDDVRRVVAGLRPPALDVLGLVGAIEEQGRALSRHPDGSEVSVHVEAHDLPALNAATEAAAYRIAVEALANVSRHSDASTAIIELAVEDGRLLLRIADDGTPAEAWRAGTGLSSMRERVAELGGTCRSGPLRGGGLVDVSFPIHVVAASELERGRAP